MTAKIPKYPVIQATIAADGSAHVTVAGDHRDYSPGPIGETRARIVDYATEVAARLGRGVRMTTLDPEGQWQLAVFPDGDVQALESATPSRRRRSPAPAAPIATIAPVVAPVPPWPAPVTPMTPPPLTLAATLRFTTGDVAVVTNRAIIGRVPEAASGAVEDGRQRIEVMDASKTMSRMHAEVVWNGGSLWLIDCGSGNGTVLYPISGRRDLQPLEPVEVADGDTIQFGPIVRAVVTIERYPTP